MLMIKGGRIVDPAVGRDEVADLFIEGDRIVPAPATPPTGAKVVDASGLVVSPGLIDLHVHLREPGGEAAETVESGSRAAARGGFTTIVAMPNTRPPLDTPERARWLIEKGRSVGLTRVLPAPCITAGRKGQYVADLEALAAAGAVAFTDDGSTVQNPDIMRAAMRRAAALDLPVMDHAQDRLIEMEGGVMHEGDVSRRHGLPGIPTHAEASIIERDIQLAEATQCAVHIQHVTSRAGVELIRAGRSRGIRVTGELTPHHLLFCDEDIDIHDADFKMNPPLRTRADRDALLAGLLDGTLNVFATDHAPHPVDHKARGFREAPFGVVGLETAVGVTYTALVKSGAMPLTAWLAAWTIHPARVLGGPTPSLEPGHVADVTLLDVEAPWTVDPNDFQSRSMNTPFKGWRLTGRAAGTLLEGRWTWPPSHVDRP